MLAPRALARRLASVPGFAWLDSDGSGAEGRFSFLAAAPVDVRRAPAGDVGALSLLDELHLPEAGSGGESSEAESGGGAQARGGDGVAGTAARGGEEGGGARRGEALGGPDGPDEPAKGAETHSREPVADAEARRDDPFDARHADRGDAGARLDPSSVPHWIGYIAYATGEAGAEGPGLCFARYAALFAFDHSTRRCFVVGDDADACGRLLGLAGVGLAAHGGEQDRVRRGALSVPEPAGDDGDARGHMLGLAGVELAAHGGEQDERVRVGGVVVPDPGDHAQAIAAAKELIGRGELYQVNLARKLSARFEAPPIALALAMREESPVPLGMFFDDGERAMVARSMERFLRWKLPERRLHTRPIKGTRARADGDGASADEQRALVADPKEHAEHAMIVDLMRNDLGRVAAIGSVEVVERFVVEAFARLHHLVSTVACLTRPELRASDILRATFPPGSVTGTPKLRAIEVIAALEAAPRGIYTGAVGFFDRAGGFSLAVAIRTAVVENGVASYFAGGGIVEASDVAREIAETELKARVFTDAIAKLAARAGGFEPP